MLASKWLQNNMIHHIDIIPVTMTGVLCDDENGQNDPLVVPDDIPASKDIPRSPFASTTQ